MGVTCSQTNICKTSDQIIDFNCCSTNRLKGSEVNNEMAMEYSNSYRDKLIANAK